MDDRGLDRSHQFPLTTEKQAEYLLELKGEETIEGRAVYRVGFRPKDKQDFLWTGETYVDKSDLSSAGMSCSS
jgi:hypothetical protein